ncbi:MAG: methyl-accepting chemotaxis protein [Geminicoccaceae bacterium]
MSRGERVSHQILDQLDRLIGGDLTVEFDDSPLGNRLQRLCDTWRDDLAGRLDDVVSHSTHNMEATIRAARILDNARETDDRSQGIAAAVVQMVASVAQISEQSREAANQANDAMAGVGKGKRNGEAVAQAMHTITDSIRATSERIGQLSESSKEIGTIVDTIADIAKKTNLLALNATIEAARAGEAGRGFAVVANEVKALSDQTSRATESIRTNITQLQHEMRETVTIMQSGSEDVAQGEQSIGDLTQSMTIINEQVRAIDERMNNIASILGEQDAATSEVAAAINEIAGRTNDNTESVSQLVDGMDSLQGALLGSMKHFDNINLPGKVLKLAKADHVAWKKKLVDMAVNRTSLKAEELADHHSCRLGKWYYSDQAAPWQNEPAFAEIEQYHADVHDHGIQAASAFSAGDLKTALRHIDAVEAASTEVLRCLDILDSKTVA